MKRLTAITAAAAFAVACPAVAQQAHDHMPAEQSGVAASAPNAGHDHGAHGRTAPDACPMHHGEGHEGHAMEGHVCPAAGEDEPVEGHDHMPTPTPAPEAAPHEGHERMMDHGAMNGAFGAYPMARDASGTAWQPDVSAHGGVHARHGAWMLMGHALFNGVYDWQDGPRGDEKTFLAGMIMGMARRDFGDGDTLSLRAMLSPDPFMGARGYPLLLAQGETANGEEPLVDRQHPHDLFMELSASYAHRLGADSSIFIYGGLPGEPAFGPPAFMHRMAAMDSPEAPITHHWFDSTHITLGVLTAGFVHDDWKLEVSRFRGRESDERRYDIETGALDSTSLRASWNPTPNWALQVSWADIVSPEQLEADIDEERVSASAIYTDRIGAEGWWSVTLGYANKARSDGVSLDAWLSEAAWHPNEAWTVFGRAEAIETDELEDHGGPVADVQRLSVGAIRDWRLNQHTVFGVGALYEQGFVPSALEAEYGGDPRGAMAFVRLRIG
jgi:hypothetical protein